MTHSGIDVADTDVIVIGLGPGGGEVATRLLDAGRSVVGVERELVGVGRRPSTAGLGLEQYGVTGAVAVDGRCRAAPGLWAVGDVTGVGAFTHLAVHQAGLAAADILGTPGPPADYTALPGSRSPIPRWAPWDVPRQRAAGLSIAVGTAPVAASSRGFVHGPGADGLIKLVVDSAHDLLVGATAVGPAGGEVLGLLALAVHARLPVATLESMILAYPTFTRGVRDALIDLRS